MKRVSFIVLIFLPLIAGCSGPKTVQKTETIMGTQVSITVVAKTEQEGEAAIDAAMAEVRRFDRMMSLYKDDSEITRVNLAAGKGPVEVSPEMIEMVEAARKISELTDGAFDVTVGPLVVLWQMRLKEGAAPTETEIESIKNRVGYRNIITDKKASTLFLMKPGMIMDFGGCAKGYVADRVAELLKGRGIDNAIVALAGDIRVMGHRPDGSSWRIGVQHPRDSAKTLTVLELSDKFISTSGDYERYQIVHRKRYHHILDPRTGKPSEGMESVTLVGDRGSDGDPLATALFILGPKQGRKIVKKLG
ncbi:MAG TPA: FAD:protein FMN transferase, partial [Nitrospirota bacterium]|nr:FAD:protein FMN transferase [Nitrospirota bacterium]